MSLATLLARSAAARPGAVALVQGDRRVSYGELGDRVARLAGHLHAAGLRPGDRVGIVQWNGIALLETLLACFHGGFLAVPVNARSTAAEAAQLLADADVSAVVHTPEYAEHVAGCGDVVRLEVAARSTLGGVTLDDAVAAADPLPRHVAAAHDPAWLFYTSGTTGRPKGATLTHRSLFTMLYCYLGDVRRTQPDHRVLHAAPLTHGGGLYALPGLAAGATQVLTTSRSYDPAEMLALIAREAVTDIAFLTPTMVKWLAEARVENAAANTTSLEHVVYGGAPMYVEDLRFAHEQFGTVFAQIFGQAEAPVTISRLTREEHRYALAHRPDLFGTAGWAYTGVNVAVCNEAGEISPTGEGEVVSRSDALMAGYWRNPAATAEALRDGWLHTGDIGAIADDGTVTLKDRSKEVIISGGANIYPREVEELLLQHAGLRQVAVIGVPDDTWGESVLAVVVARPGQDTDVLGKELNEMCQVALSGYKRPRRFEWRPELPTSSYGKVLKRELRETYWSDRDRRI